MILQAIITLINSDAQSIIISIIGFIAYGLTLYITKPEIAKRLDFIGILTRYISETPVGLKANDKRSREIQKGN